MPICCVNGCTNRYNPGSTVRFYRIPSGSRQFQIKRRRLWIEAIQRANGNGSKIGADVRICGAHFITGEASTDPDMPNFVPTLFPSPKKRQAPSRIAQCTPGRRTRNQQKLHADTKTKSGTEDTKTEESPTQPVSESLTDHQYSFSMETQDEPLPETQTMLCTSEVKEEETEDEKISDKKQVETTTKTEPETVKLESKSSIHLTPSLQKPLGGILNLDRMNPVVLLEPLVLPKSAYQVDLIDQTNKEQQEEEEKEEDDDMSQTVATRDQPLFPCNMCDRTFSTSHYLKRHKLLHVRDVRKCLRCGTLFCRRHNHVLFQTRAEPLPESDESSSSSKEELLVDDVNTEKGKAREVTEMPENSLSTRSDTSPYKPPLSNSLVLMTPNLTDTKETLLVSEKPAPAPSPPSPICRSPNSQGTLFQIRPLLSDTSPASGKPNLPQQPQLPSSLKMFSTQHLTSALLDVQRNYEYILSKPKKQVVQIKEEPEEPVNICTVEQPVVQPMKPVGSEKIVKWEKIAYDLEVVI